MINETLRVGLIQTSLDWRAAWTVDGCSDWKSYAKISHLEEIRARSEIRTLLAAIDSSKAHPHIVVLPELSVPLGHEKELIGACEAMEAVFVAGLDYRVDDSSEEPTVSNEALVIVPKKLSGKRIALHTDIRRVGKTYPAPREAKRLSSNGIGFKPFPTVWLFQSQLLGNFGIILCYDFLDLDRIVMYRGRIQTLFILAYNRDTTSFRHAAEAIARMVFCNVVICNCGHFGGSIAVSPYRKPYRRTIFQHKGMGLTVAQVIELPLAALREYQESISEEPSDFKSLPPGYASGVSLDLTNEYVP